MEEGSEKACQYRRYESLSDLENADDGITGNVHNTRSNTPQTAEQINEIFTAGMY